MTDKELNDLIRSQILKNLDELGGTPDLLQETDAAFKIKGFHHCIYKHPYQEKINTMFHHGDSKSNNK